MLRCSTFVILVVTHPKPLLAQLAGAFLWTHHLPTTLVEGRLAPHVDLGVSRPGHRYEGKGKRGGRRGASSRSGEQLLDGVHLQIMLGIIVQS